MGHCSHLPTQVWSICIYMYITIYTWSREWWPFMSRRSKHEERWLLFHPSFCAVPAAYFLLPVCFAFVSGFQHFTWLEFNHNLWMLAKYCITIIPGSSNSHCTFYSATKILRFKSKHKLWKLWLHLLKLLKSSLISFMKTCSLNIITKAKRPTNSIIVSAHAHI